MCSEGSKEDYDRNTSERHCRHTEPPLRPGNRRETQEHPASKGSDAVRLDRSQRRSRKGRFEDAADEVVDFWQPESRHSTDARFSEDRDRPSPKNIDLGRLWRKGLGQLQRPHISPATTWSAARVDTKYRSDRNAGDEDCGINLPSQCRSLPKYEIMGGQLPSFSKIPATLKRRAAAIQVLLMDVDGTMTEGGVTLLS